MEQANLSDVLRLSHYREGREHIFSSPGALLWFVRRHRARLAEAGALVMLSGQWHAHGHKFDAFVLEEGQRAARRHGT